MAETQAPASGQSPRSGRLTRRCFSFGISSQAPFPFFWASVRLVRAEGQSCSRGPRSKHLWGSPDPAFPQSPSPQSVVRASVSGFVLGEPLQFPRLFSQRSVLVRRSLPKLDVVATPKRPSCSGTLLLPGSLLNPVCGALEIGCLARTGGRGSLRGPSFITGAGWHVSSAPAREGQASGCNFLASMFCRLIACPWQSLLNHEVVSGSASSLRLPACLVRVFLGFAQSPLCSSCRWRAQMAPKHLLRLALELGGRFLVAL